MKTSSLGRSMLAGSGFLGLIALLGAVLVAVTEQYGSQRILANEQQFLSRQVRELMSRVETLDSYEAHLESAEIKLAGLSARADMRVRCWRGLVNGRPQAAVFEIYTSHGYNGGIHLLAGVRRDGSLLGVRVLSHKETPGLGDAIELDRSDWMSMFTDLSLEMPPTENWLTARDGGHFDQITGATVTSRAVVDAVKKMLLEIDNLSEVIFPPGEDENQRALADRGGLPPRGSP